MKKNVREEIGKAVYRRFERKVSQRMRVRDKDAVEMLQRRAADLAYRMPFVTMPFRNYGLIDNKHQPILPLFRPNLWAQDYAHDVGKLGQMDLFTAGERAEAVVEHELEKNYLQRLLRAKRLDEGFVFRSVNESALIESVYQSRIAGDDMPEDVRKKVDIALIVRCIKSGNGLRDMCQFVGADITDPRALLQIADSIDLTGGLRQVVDNQPYFFRRRENIAYLASAKPINSEKSAQLAVGDDVLVGALFERYLRKKNADPMLIKAFEDFIRRNRAS